MKIYLALVIDKDKYSCVSLFHLLNLWKQSKTYDPKHFDRYLTGEKNRDGEKEGAKKIGICTKGMCTYSS